MIEGFLLQTNSTITTTVLQQTTGWSFLGASLTDWITVITAIAVAAFAGVTVWEGVKNRRKGSIEKQLEKLYNPMYEIMDWAVREQSASDKSQGIVSLGFENYGKLMNIFLGYGHYLRPEVRERVKQLLLSPLSKGHVRTYREKEFNECLSSIAHWRIELMVSLYKLRGFPWKLPA